MSQVLSQKEWEKVQRALESKKWNFRSVAGIAKEIGLTPERVRELLTQNSRFIRTTLSRDRRVVYALKSKPVTTGEIIDSVLTLASR